MNVITHALLHRVHSLFGRYEGNWYTVLLELPPFRILLYQIIEIRHLKTNKNRIFNSSNMTNFKIISHCTSILKFNPNYKTISLILFYRLIHTRLQQFKVDSEYPPHIWWNIITMWFSFNYLITINLLNFACCCLSLLLKHQMLLTNSGH